MRKFKVYFSVLLIILSACSEKEESNLNFVDPSIGGAALLLVPTRPTVHLPNSLIRVYPERKDQLDDQIDNFFLTATMHRLSAVFAFMPVSGNSDELWDKPQTYDSEILTPYYYKSRFEDSGDIIEFTPQSKSGFYRISFTGDDSHHIRMANYGESGEIKADTKHIITGIEEFWGMKAYFYAETDAEILETQTKHLNNKDCKLFTFGNKAQTVSFKYGISYISIEQAKQNLYNEIADFDFEQVKNHAKNSWDKKLSQIEVKGGTEAQKRVFYTALYRTYERMVDINEYGRYYSAYDHKVHESDEPFYVDNWLWDSYIAHEPLHMILDPVKATECIRSYVKMYEQSGTMPSFALVSGHLPAMIGNHAAAWMADAWFKGLRNFDLETAYEGIKKNSLEETLLPWRNGPKSELDDFYNENGYIPGLYPGEEETVKEVSLPWERRQSVSVTIENSYDDWCIAQLANELNKSADKELFLERAENYRNVFRADKGFMWPKDKDGKWIEPYDPRFADRMYFTENNAFTYNWYVKHDLQGLFGLMDSTKGAEAILDQLFREELGMRKQQFWNSQPDATGLVGHFVMGNEPSFHIPYIYNYLGAPWKTQKRIRFLMDAFFTDTYFGIPGDEDGGGMSAFVVFSMMGFFQVTPGIPVYSIGSPVFEEVSIKLPDNKTFKIIATNSNAGNKYIQKATLNGKDLTRAWFTHSEMMSGGILKLEMGTSPNKNWGSEKENLPHMKYILNRIK